MTYPTVAATAIICSTVLLVLCFAIAVTVWNERHKPDWVAADEEAAKEGDREPRR